MTPTHSNNPHSSSAWCWGSDSGSSRTQLAIMRTHRHQAPEKSGLPRQLSDIAKLFDIILQLQPEGKDIHIKALKGPATGAGSSELFLDPATMLITNNR